MDLSLKLRSRHALLPFSPTLSVALRVRMSRLGASLVVSSVSHCFTLSAVAFECLRRTCQGACPCESVDGRGAAMAALSCLTRKWPHSQACSKCVSSSC
eukprot:4501313-Pleurochrysis_carterae.AAC.4